MSYKIIINNEREISKEDFKRWSGLSDYIVDCLAKQNVFQQMPDGSTITFKCCESN